jgi:hypothetical protein
MRVAYKEVPITRKPFADDLNKGTASPVGDKTESTAAFDAVGRVYPDVELTYVGANGREHFFQRWGDPTAYVVPVSTGWVLTPSCFSGPYKGVQSVPSP